MSCFFVGTLKKPFLSRTSNRANLRKKEGNSSNAAVYNVSYSKQLRVGQPKAATTASQAPPTQRTNQRKNSETMEFTPIPKTYGELFKNLLHNPRDTTRWLNANTMEAPQDIRLRIAQLSKGRRRIKASLEEIRSPSKWVWQAMIKAGLLQDHDIQHCVSFKALVQKMMDNKELEFFKKMGLEKLIFVLQERRS
ncbi:hypothetical protein GQ457_14G018300 [Hibiscus cannabinus]